MSQKPPRRALSPLMLPLAVLAVVATFGVLQPFRTDQQTQRMTLSQLITTVERSPEAVSGVVFKPKNQEISAKLANGRSVKVHYPTPESQIAFQRVLERKGILFDSKSPGRTSPLASLLLFLLPLVLIVGLFVFL